MSDQQDRPFDESAAQDAGYAAGEAQQGFQEFGNDARRDEQSIENMPENVGRDIMVSRTLSTTALTHATAIGEACMLKD